MTARKAAHSLQRAKGALASGFATVDLHHARGHDRKGSNGNARCRLDDYLPRGRHRTDNRRFTPAVTGTRIAATVHGKFSHVSRLSYKGFIAGRVPKDRLGRLEGQPGPVGLQALQIRQAARRAAPCSALPIHARRASDRAARRRPAEARHFADQDHCPDRPCGSNRER